MLQVGHTDLIKAKLGSFGSQGYILYMLPPEMYPACPKKYEICHIVLIN